MHKRVISLVSRYLYHRAGKRVQTRECIISFGRVLSGNEPPVDGFRPPCSLVRSGRLELERMRQPQDYRAQGERHRQERPSTHRRPFRKHRSSTLGSSLRRYVRHLGVVAMKVVHPELAWKTGGYSPAAAKSSDEPSLEGSPRRRTIAALTISFLELSERSQPSVRLLRQPHHSTGPTRSMRS
jgi:hypothetical protein